MRTNKQKKSRHSFIICFLLAFLFIMKSLFAIPGESYPKIPDTGAWCWPQDPRAIYFKGAKEKTYMGSVDEDGNINVWSYDHQTGDTAISTLYKSSPVDDHNAPSLYVHDDNRITAFYTRHGMDARIRYRKTVNPEDISSWQAEKTISLPDAQWGSSYTHQFRLTNENDRVYLFVRNINWGPTMLYSDDDCNTWSTPREVAHSTDRPYTKYVSDEESRIHFTFNDGHPRVQPNNSVYYMYMEGGKFYKADGTFIKDTSDLPVQTGSSYEADRVYDGSTNGKSWVWDIALDENRRPVIVFAVFPDDLNHHYYYARWTGTEWLVKDLVNAGKWFPQTPSGTTEPEPNYSPGVSLDHHDPSVVYLSRFVNDQCEIEKWTTADNGATWSSTAITSGSAKRNVRPIAAWPQPFGTTMSSKPIVFWMEGDYIEYTNYSTTIRYNIEPPELTMPTKKEVVKHMRRVVDYWIVGNENPGDNKWQKGTFFSGLMFHYNALREKHYIEYAEKWGEQNNWELFEGVNTRMADNHCCGQAYIWLHRENPDTNKISMIKQSILNMVNSTKKDDWWWIDALHMAMPVFTELGILENNTAFFNKMYDLYDDNKSRRNLYDTDNHLWYRDENYDPPAQTPNGKPIHWSRGNGWVFGAHTKVLRSLPSSDPHHAEYLQTFQEMADALRQIQRSDGLWNSSLVDPNHFGGPETTGSVFFTFGYAWGINSGNLDSAIYIQPLLKAWKGLTTVSEQPDGLLGYCQNDAVAPGQAEQGHTKDYGVGIFGAAASEILKMATGPMPDLTNNLVKNKCTDFSNELTNYRAADAVDGNIISRWSANGYPQWIECDMGNSYQFDEIEVHGYLNRAYKYKVEGKTSSGGNWTTILDKQSNTVGGKMIDSVDAIARYIRLTVTGCTNSSDQLMGINDFRVYSNDVTSIKLPIAEPHQSILSVKLVSNGFIVGVAPHYASGNIAVMRVTLTTPLGRTIYGKSFSMTKGRSQYRVSLNEIKGKAAPPAAGLYIVSVMLVDRQGGIVGNFQQPVVLMR